MILYHIAHVRKQLGIIELRPSRVSSVLSTPLKHNAFKSNKAYMPYGSPLLHRHIQWIIICEHDTCKQHTAIQAYIAHPVLVGVFKANITPK